jgi:hypothetical protein
MIVPGYTSLSLGPNSIPSSIGGSPTGTMPFNLASGDSPDEIEFEIKPIKMIFDYLSKEITQLRAEKEEY